MMDDSYDRTRSLSEKSPLLDDSSISPIINDHESPVLPKTSIFTCAVICILFTELCERLTFYGISGNLVLFATDDKHLNLTSAQASVVSYLFSGTCYTAPILGGWLADAVVGKFSAILISAVFYLIGTLLLPLGSITSERSENSDMLANHITDSVVFKRVTFLIGLTLVAFGTGGIKANVSPFGAEQVSNRGHSAIQAFFSWFYWFINIGAMLSFTLVVYLQQYVSYFYGNLLPAVSLVLALIIFLAGRRSYSLRAPTGSVLTNTLKIAKEAIKRSRRPSLSSSLVSHWLDRAKLCFGGTYNSWEVENVKKVYRVMPIFVMFILYWTVYAQMNTAMIFQGEYMDTDLGSIQIPVASLSILDTLGVLILIPIMDKIVYPLLARFDIRPSQLQRIGFGMLVAAASMTCAGILEWYRVKNGFKSQKRHSGNIERVSDLTIFYQVPQYLFIGLSEVFTSITGLELAYTESPKSLQGVIMGVFLLTTGLGSYVGAALVAIVNAISGAISGEDGKWYPDKENINNKSPHLAYYFFLLAALMVLNFFLYIFVAMNFKAKKEAAARARDVSGGLSNDVDPAEVPKRTNSKPGHSSANSERPSNN